MEHDADMLAAMHRQRSELLAEVNVASVLDVQAIAEGSPLLSQQEVRQLTQEADRILAERLAAMNELTEAKATSAIEDVDSGTGVVTEVNERLGSLPDRIRAGQINLGDALKELDDHLRVRDQVRQHQEGVRARAERVEAEEEDPLAVLRAWERKWPALKATIHGGILRLPAHDPHHGSRGQ